MDYYERLGLTRTATADEIAKAYRQKAIQFHPDKNPGNVSAVQEFKQCAEAYEVLSDVAKKSQYDVQGYVGRKPANWRPPPKPKPKPKTAEDFKKEFEAKADRPATKEEVEAIPCSFFGGSNSGRNIQAHLFLTKEQLRAGGRYPLKIKKRGLCNGCVGDGYVFGPCPKCFVNRDYENLQMHCPTCNGSKMVEKKCGKCGGEGVSLWSISEVLVAVSPGTNSGQQIRIAGEGESAPHKMPGYLQVVVLEQQ